MGELDIGLIRITYTHDWAAKLIS